MSNHSSILIKNIIVLITLFISTTVFSQQINVSPIGDVKVYAGESNKARVDFVSSSPDLIIEENNGETMLGPEKTNNGKYLYSFICDVTDTNKFGFIVTARGAVNSFTSKPYIEEGQLLEYEVTITELPVSISEIKKSASNGIVTQPNTALVTVTSNYQDLRIESSTGEQVEGPVFNATNTFDYTIQYDLSTPESRELSRVLSFSVGNGEPVKQDLEPLSPKQAIGLSVIVITNTCYTDAVNHAKQSFLNGAYLEAYSTYKKLLEDNECIDKPDDTRNDEEELKVMRGMAVAYQQASQYYEKAEDFKAENQLDSCMYYHAEAYKYRNYILKRNPSDPYCLEYNRKYDNLTHTFPRIVSGQIVNAVRMNTQGKNLPLSGVYIIQTAHKRDTKKVNGIQVPDAGKEIVPRVIKNLGTSDANGEFTVPVDRNTPDIIYVLNFTVDGENFSDKSYSFKYIPKDVDKESKAYIKMTPKGVNKYNETR